MTPFRDRSRSKPEARSRAVIRQVAAWCLHYPDHELLDRLTLLRECVAELGDTSPATHLLAVLDHLDSTPARVAEQHYVEVFDTRPRRGLHLTWYVDGDTRNRGASLAELMLLYRGHGFRIDNGELPDYLPALLEFTATTEPAVSADGERVLARFRPALGMLHRNLTKVATPYADAVAAVLTTLPASDPRRAAPADPPPIEQVGLEPYPGPATQAGPR